MKAKDKIKKAVNKVVAKVKSKVKKTTKPKVDPTVARSSVPRTEKEVQQLQEKVQSKAPIYDKYGVCLACKGGDPECHHNNLVQNGPHVYCALCGYCVK